MFIMEIRGFPIAFALMSRKTVKAYDSLFKRLLEIEPQWKPKTIIVDFERAVQMSIKTIFRNTNIRGCWFHSSQALWRKVGELGMIEMCNTNRNVYDIVHMLMALPLLPRDKLMEGFVSVTDFYVQNVQHHLSLENCNAFNRYFQYYKSTWLQGPNADILSVNGVIWRTNNVLEVSHQHLRMHMGNAHQPEPWVFLNGLIAYSSGLLADYNLAIDGIQIREPQRQFWIDHQRNLDLASRLLNEGRYSVMEFLACTKHVTPNFGVVRPPLFIQPIPEVQPVVENQIDAREFILQRWPIVNEQINILHLIHGLDDEDEEDIPRAQPTTPQIVHISLEDLAFEPIVSDKCYICQYSIPTVIASPCKHQGLCAPCHETYTRMPRYRNIPYYRCPLCRGEITTYYIIV
uniref:RING-type domain-containing protein n=1 Tax=Schizaphis graminum TaxID=13262 RepID=A0A2S2PLB3_SCHGA